MKHDGENDAVHRRGAHHGAWVALAVLVDAHIGIEICAPDHPDWAVLRGFLVVPAEELLVGENHARQVQKASTAAQSLPRRLGYGRFPSRPRFHSFAAASADVTRLEHHDAAT